MKFQCNMNGNWNCQFELQKYWNLDCKKNFNKADMESVSTDPKMKSAAKL